MNIKLFIDNSNDTLKNVCNNSINLHNKKILHCLGMIYDGFDIFTPAPDF
jgi:hypothetical protein